MNRRWMTLLVFVLSLGLSSSALAQGKGKGKGKDKPHAEKPKGKPEDKGKPDKEEKEHKDHKDHAHKPDHAEKHDKEHEGKHDHEGHEGHQGKALGKDKPHPGKGKALGKDKAALRKSHLSKETRKHMTRQAKLDRLEGIAKDKSDATLSEKVTSLREKELKRHERAVARINKGELDAQPEVESAPEAAPAE